MVKSTVRRIKILSDAEINELYGLPSFNHADREDFFSLDDETQLLVDECRRIETKCYFILLLGYFRSKPIIFNFSFSEVQSDVEYIEKKYFSGKKVKPAELSPTTKTKLINRLLNYVGYSLYQSKLYKSPLIEKLNDSQQSALNLGMSLMSAFRTLINIILHWQAIAHFKNSFLLYWLKNVQELKTFLTKACLPVPAQPYSSF